MQPEDCSAIHGGASSRLPPVGTTQCPLPVSPAAGPFVAAMLVRTSSGNTSVGEHMVLWRIQGWSGLGTSVLGPGGPCPPLGVPACCPPPCQRPWRRPFEPHPKRLLQAAPPRHQLPMRRPHIPSAQPAAVRCARQPGMRSGCPAQHPPSQHHAAQPRACCTCVSPGGASPRAYCDWCQLHTNTLTLRALALALQSPPVSSPTSSHS